MNRRAVPAMQARQNACRRHMDPCAFTTEASLLVVLLVVVAAVAVGAAIAVAAAVAVALVAATCRFVLLRGMPLLRSWSADSAFDDDNEDDSHDDADVDKGHTYC